MLDVPTVTSQTLELAKGISEYGIMNICSAILLLLCVIAMVSFFKWFMKLMNKFFDDFSAKMGAIINKIEGVGDKMNDISEGLRTETKSRIEFLSNTIFDLAVEKVLNIIRRVRKENHLDKMEQTKRKIRTMVTNLYNGRKNGLENFTYKGESLDNGMNTEWIDRACEVIENEVYDSDYDEERARTNVIELYKNIRNEFTQNIL